MTTSSTFTRTMFWSSCSLRICSMSPYFTISTTPVSLISNKVTEQLGRLRSSTALSLSSAFPLLTSPLIKVLRKRPWVTTSRLYGSDLGPGEAMCATIEFHQDMIRCKRSPSLSIGHRMAAPAATDSPCCSPINCRTKFPLMKSFDREKKLTYPLSKFLLSMKSDTRMIPKDELCSLPSVCKVPRKQKWKQGDKPLLPCSDRCYMQSRRELTGVPQPPLLIVSTPRRSTWNPDVLG